MHRRPRERDRAMVTTSDEGRVEPGAPSAGAGRWLRGTVPGELGGWVVVLADMTVFAVLFAVFLVQRAADPTGFAQARGELDVAVGMVNTIVLLTSSLLVVYGVHAYRDARRDLAARLFAGGAALGAVFLCVKVAEWGGKFASGITPMSGDFFLYFFILTGIHALHVVLGIGGLLGLRALARTRRPRPSHTKVVELGGIVWHMVDLLWIILFPLLYLAS
ncbi:Nitric oxide reductase activation protein NorE [Pseudonocardia sp. Ae168_Ps1]|nr:Nitric oxide reductase activation protein NorE [Pseudonocardia sp. Ae150A_Ps1]OLL79429.1 Nitric oxide reductase activation protein NorE [Pseudonocardia sp. Ae168_Ps1]OLL93522.1 Nitric oxide reductase activation protein NorE [Pseudonocardia sp. Ae356_Ps1]